jgi:adenine-specific DNA-methyltransferase
LSRKQIDTALFALKELGLPKGQQNDRSAMVLLAVLNLSSRSSWQKCERPLIGVTPIIKWIEEKYRVKYAPNTRETIRRQTLHQFEQAGIVEYNPDQPERPVNSPHAVYQISLQAHQLLISLGTKSWHENLKIFHGQHTSLAESYAAKRLFEKVSATLPDGKTLLLSPGAHSNLIAQIINVFAPRFLPGAKLLYAGDTGSKTSIFDLAGFAECGLEINLKGKLPDAVFHHVEKGWLVLIEAVTSHGPVNPKRLRELRKLFGKSKAGLVFVSAFPDERFFVKFAADIAWETEVWIASNPDHMIHFNGKRFLGPY